MSIAGKVKGLLSSNGKDHAGLASALGISSQALSNKFYRDSFTTTNEAVSLSSMELRYCGFPTAK